MTHWSHGHTFLGGLLAGLALALHVWVLLAIIAAGGALGAALLLAAVGVAHRVADLAEGRRRREWARHVGRDDHWSRRV